MCNDLPDHWSRYALIQDKIRNARPHEIDGLEAQLDKILECISVDRGVTDADLHRARDTHERKARRRQSLLRRFPQNAYFFNGNPDPEQAAVAKFSLREIVRTLTPEEIDFLMKAAANDLGALPGKAGTKRVRLHRIRRKIANHR